MRKLGILLVILLISGGIVALEFWRDPQRAQFLKGAATQGVTEGTGTNSTDLPLSQVSEKNFELSGISGVTLKRRTEVHHLFGRVQITAEEDHMIILKSDFFETVPDQALISVYEIFPLNDTTAAKAFLSIHDKFESSFTNTAETGIHQTDDFGIHSFYFNPSDDPKKSFLLGVSSDRLLGFEYLKEDHNKLLPFLFQLLPAAPTASQENTSVK